MDRDRGPAPIGAALDQLKASGAIRPASEIPAPAAAKPPEKLPISTQFLHRGRVFSLNLSSALSLAKLDRVCDRLDALGLKPVPLPVAYTPNGEPVCPQHHAVMTRHEKQGDEWFSHKLVDARGQPCYCKGRPGKDSPGWDLP